MMNRIPLTIVISMLAFTATLEGIQKLLLRDVIRLLDPDLSSGHRASRREIAADFGLRLLPFTVAILLVWS